MNIDFIELISLALMIVSSTLFALAVIWLGCGIGLGVWSN